MGWRRGWEGSEGVPERASWLSCLQTCPAEPRSLARAVVTARRPSASNAWVPGSGFVFLEFQATCRSPLAEEEQNYVGLWGPTNLEEKQAA